MGNSAPKPGSKKEAKLKKKLAKKAEEKRVGDIVVTQRILSALEIKQSWKIVFGREHLATDWSIEGLRKDKEQKEKDRKERNYEITGITQRNLWMEEHCLYRKITALKPDELFHPVQAYSLRYQPPKSLFQLIIPLNDPRIQESALIEIAKLDPVSRASLTFFFAPINVATPMYAELTHPASLVSFKTKNAVLRKLSDYFLEGRLSIEEMQQIFYNNYDTWRPALYNIMPNDWQPYHEYLNVREPVPINEKAIAKEYIDGHINLTEYADLKYPERKKLKDIRALKYPLPFTGGTCIIGECNEGVGCIQCQNCENMACVDCVQSLFNYGEDSAGSFLLLHHSYCLRMGKMNHITPRFVSEAGYMREFRATTKLAQVDRLIGPKVEVVITEELDDEDSEDEEERARLEKERIAAELERERLERENPPALQELREKFKEKQKKFQKLMKELGIFDDKINSTGGREEYVNRNKRLKRESLVKLGKTVKTPVTSLHTAVAVLKEEGLTGEFVEGLEADCFEVIGTCDLQMLWTGEEDEEGEEKEDGKEDAKEEGEERENLPPEEKEAEERREQRRLVELEDDHQALIEADIEAEVQAAINDPPSLGTLDLG